jgi:hypothetical protein
MGAFKTFDARDVILTPFTVNKGFSFYGNSEFTGSGLDKFIGLNQTGLFSTSTGNDILDYSLNVFNSQDQVAIPYGQLYFVPNFTVAEIPPQSELTDEYYLSGGGIYFPQNIKNTELYATFSADYFLYSNIDVNSYNIYVLVTKSNILNQSSSELFSQFYSSNTNFTAETLVSNSIEIPITFTPLEGDIISIGYSPILIGNGNEIGIPTTFQELNTSFVISSQSIAPSASQPLTGINNTIYQRSVYDSIKQLYYTNYIGNPYPAPIYYTGSDIYTQFDNYLQSFPLDVRQFPTESNAKIGVISIPSLIYGEYIKPGSFVYKSESIYVYDDSNGNLLNSVDNKKCGNIIYSHGLAVITTSSFISNLDSFITASNTTCSFSSSLTIFETLYKCTIRENEFNFSQNPSIISGSEGDLYYYASSSYFEPYVTTVGLYNENQDLLAVAKLSQPLPSSTTTDTNILIKLDT